MGGAETGRLQANPEVPSVNLERCSGVCSIRRPPWTSSVGSFDRKPTTGSTFWWLPADDLAGSALGADQFRGQPLPELQHPRRESVPPGAESHGGGRASGSVRPGRGSVLSIRSGELRRALPLEVAPSEEGRRALGCLRPHPPGSGLPGVLPGRGVVVEDYAPFMALRTPSSQAWNRGLKSCAAPPEALIRPVPDIAGSARLLHAGLTAKGRP